MGDALLPTLSGLERVHPRQICEISVQARSSTNRDSHQRSVRLRPVIRARRGTVPLQRLEDQTQAA